MSDKNFKVKNGLDAVGPITISPSSNSIDGIVINTLTGGKAIRFIRVGSGEVASIDEWGGFVSSGGISVAQPWYTRTPGLESQSFFWASSSTRSAAGFGGTSTGTNPVVYISSHGSGVNDLTQWVTPNNTILAKVDYLGNVTANDLTLAGNLTVNGTTTNLNSTNLIIEDKNIIIADVATPTDTTADGAGITIKGTTDKTFSWINSTKSFTSSEPLIINNSSITTVPLVIKGYASQTANLTEWQNNSNQVVSSIRSNGGLSINYANSIRLFNTANTDYASLWMDNGSGGTNLYVKTNYPVLMGDVGVDTGASLTVATQGVSQVGQVIRGIASQSADLQQWQRSNGNPDLKVTNFGALISGGGTTIASNPTINAYGAALVVNSGINTYPMVILKAASSQAANIQEWQNSAGTKVSTISPLGYLSINKSYTSYPLEVNGSLYAKDATAGSLYIQGGNNLLYPSVITSAGGNGWTSVTANYAVSPDGTTSATRYVWASNGNCYTTPAYTVPNIANVFYTASMYVKPNISTSKIILSIRPGDSSDNSNVEFDASTNTVSYSQKTPTSVFSNGTAGSIYVGNGWYRIWVTSKISSVLSGFTTMITSNNPNGDVSVWGVQLEKGYYASAYTPTTNAIVSTTNNLYVPSGDVYSASIQSIVSGTATLNTNGDTGAILINTVAAANKGLIIRGAASQTANLQEWQNSDAVAVAQISATGTISTKPVGFSGNLNTAIISVTDRASTWTAGNFAFRSDSGGIPRFSFTGPNASTEALTINGNNVGVQTPFPSAVFQVTSNAAGNIATIIKGAASQTANLQEWQNSAGTVLGKITTNGHLTAQRVYAPDSLYVVATGGPGTVNIETYASNGIGVIIKGKASQTANLQEWQDSSGTVLSNITYFGGARLYDLGIKGSPAGIGWAYFGNDNTSTKNVVVRAFASQTANLTEWQDSAGTALAVVSNIGTVRASVFANLTGGLSYIATNFDTSGIGIVISGAAQKGLIVRGAASQTANLQEWQNSGGTVLAKVTSTGDATLGYAYVSGLRDVNGTGPYLNMQASTSGILVNTRAAANIGLVVKGAASQTANLQEWQDSAGTILTKIDSSGALTINNASGASSIFTANAAGGGYFAVGPYGGISTNGGLSSIGGGSLFGGYGGTSNVVVTVKGASGQTGDLQKWTNFAGTTLANVDSSGNITDASNTAWLSPIGSGSNDAVAIQALIDAGKKEIRLGSGQWTFSTRIKVPNGVTIRGTGTSGSSTTGTRVNAVALIASEGTVRDITFTGAGENAQSELGGSGIAVLGGRVIDCSVTDSRWVLAPTRQAHGYLKNFMSKMQGSYGSVKVAVLGDSLSENTSTTSWYGYLFNTATTATGYYLGSYFGHQIAPSEVDNMAIGGQGAYLLSAQLAMTKDTVRTGDYVNQVLDGDSVSTSPFFSRDYSLAILAIGQNGGEDWKAHLEYTVKSIRDKGIDVIILTQNPAASAPTSRAGDEYYYRSIAETYGCLLVDTQAYFRLEVEFGRALGTTADLFGDGIHQSALGHQLYAKAILNGILDYDSTITVPSNPVVVGRSYVPAQADRATAIAGLNAYYLVKKPDPSRGISGVTYTSATDSSIKNPIYGRGTTTNSVATIASGGYATWGVEYATAAYIIYRENATVNTLTVALQAGGSTLATLTTGVTNGRTSVQKVMLSGGYPVNKAIRITNTTGDPVQIYGVVFETHADVAFNRNTDGSYPGVKLNGSWAYSNLLSMVGYGSYLTPYTSTTNDSVTFKFYGDGLRFSTSYGKNSGILQVKIDDTTYNTVDTYTSISEYGVYSHFYGGLQYGLHTATITLTGANASVTGLNSDGARFGLHRITAVRSSWYLTQDQQLAPNSDISANINSLSSPIISSAGGANAVDLTIKGATTVGSGTTEKLISFKSSANSEIGYVVDTGYGATLSQFNYLYTTVVQGWNGVGGSINFANSTPITISPQSSSVTSLVTKGVASQSANLQEWQNSAGTVLASINASGNLILGNQYISNSGSSAYGRFQPLDGGTNQTILYPASAGMLIANAGVTGMVVVKVKGASGQTANLQEWQNSAGTALAKIDPLGNFTATSKSFDIIHPTKENMRLRYGSLEGPENGVYIRGTAESNIIELPDYWTGLVHSDSITVSLTSVGSSQNIYVEKIENNKVYIGGNLEKAFFTVYGERKDIDRLTVEY